MQFWIYVNIAPEWAKISLAPTMDDLSKNNLMFESVYSHTGIGVTLFFSDLMFNIVTSFD